MVRESLVMVIMVIMIIITQELNHFLADKARVVLLVILVVVGVMGSAHARVNFAKCGPGMRRGWAPIIT